MKQQISKPGIDHLARLMTSKAEHVAADKARARWDNEAREAGRKWSLEEATYEDLARLVYTPVDYLLRCPQPEGKHNFLAFQEGAKEVLNELNGKGGSQ